MGGKKKKKTTQQDVKFWSEKLCFCLAVDLLSVEEAQHFMLGTGKQTCLNY